MEFKLIDVMDIGDAKKAECGIRLCFDDGPDVDEKSYELNLAYGESMENIAYKLIVLGRRIFHENEPPQ